MVVAADTLTTRANERMPASGCLRRATAMQPAVKFDIEEGAVVYCHFGVICNVLHMCKVTSVDVDGANVQCVGFPSHNRHVLFSDIYTPLKHTSPPEPPTRAQRWGKDGQLNARVDALVRRERALQASIAQHRAASKLERCRLQRRLTSVHKQCVKFVLDAHASASMARKALSTINATMHAKLVRSSS